MSIRKTIIVTAAIAASVAMVAPSFAGAVTIAELQAQINALLAQLQTLQGQPSDTGGIPSACIGITFTRNLAVGATGSDVKCLQALLNTSASTQVATTGAGSPGSETSYFGQLTLVAVKKYQTAHGWTPANQVGPLTRAALNATLGGGVVTPGPVVTPSAGGLSIGLAFDTPASTNVPKGAFGQTVTKFNLTAGSGDVQISRIALTRTGLSANTDVDLVKLYDGTIQKGSGASLNSNNQAVITLTTPITVAANTTKTLTVKIDIYSLATSGATIAFGVAAPTDVTSNATSTTGTATGNAVSVVGTTIGSITIAAGPNNPSSDLAPNVGDTGVRVLQMNLLAGSTEAVKVTQVIAVKVGTVNNTDISKIELFNDTDNTSLATVSTFDAEGRATFDLASPLLIDKGYSKNLSVKVDIASGSARTVSVKVKDAGSYTVTAIGQTYGFGVGFASSSWAGTATSQIIAAGSLIVTKSSSTPAAGYVAPGGTDVPLVTYDIEARGEGVIVTNFTNTVVLSSVTYGQVTACKLVDENSNVVAGPVDTATAGAATDDFIRFTDTFTVPLGVHKYTVKCNLATAITTGTIQVGFENGNTLTVASGGVADTDTPEHAITAKGASSNDTITASPDSDVLGNSQTVRAVAMTITTLTTPVATSIVPGQANIHFANIQFGASSSGENINITQIRPTDTKVGGASAYDDIANLRLFDAAITQANCTGTGRAWDSTLSMCRIAPIAQPLSTSATTIFTLSTPLVVTKGSSETVRVYGDYKAGVGTTSESHTFNIAGAALTLVAADTVAVGATTGTTLTLALMGTSAVGAGQTMTYASGGVGTLTTALDNGRPNSANIAVGDYGVTGVTVTKMKFTANYEPITLNTIDLSRITGTGLTTGVNADIAAVHLYGSDSASGALTLIADGVFRTGAKYRFTFPANYQIAAATSKWLTVKVDFNGILNGATSGYADTFALANASTTDLDATGAASGTAIGASATVNGTDAAATTYMVLYKSIPTISLCAISDGTCATHIRTSLTLNKNSALEIMRVKVHADAAGDINFTSANTNSLRFKLSGSVTDGTSGTTITIKNITDNTTLQSITTAVGSVIGGTAGNPNYYLPVSFTSALQIAAGGDKIVTLEVDTTDMGDVGDNVTASIQNAAADMVWGDDTSAGATINNNTFFTWLPLTGDTFNAPVGASD